MQFQQVDEECRSLGKDRDEKDNDDDEDADDEDDTNQA